MTAIQVILYVLAVPAVSLAAAAAEQVQCRVCTGVIDGIKHLHGVLSRDLHNTGVAMDACVLRYCQQSFLNSAQRKLCYHLEPMKVDVAQLIQRGLPPDRVCTRLSSSNPDVCAVEQDAAALSFKPGGEPAGMSSMNCTVEYTSSRQSVWVALQ
ncbi:hypothetical protein JKP88DRAFT_267570 [Tribonema minus]|uniref:Saposin B-type domain-containing protein n=1 Tax=Tribonema minus TaxID=303371 RepID=A0A836CK57_9STRA|nr:hypothetical protein JKP88DRAFT_267570 [Tribonema minus]